MEFVISAEDHDLACPVLEMRFVVNDPRQLADLIPEASIDDPAVWNRWYDLEDATWRRIVSTLAIPFDTAGLEGRQITVCLWRMARLSRLPYLVHTGCELFLLLDGRKKLARMGDAYPPLKFRGEEAFDRWVDAGHLHREEVIEPFEKAHPRGWHGHRTVYYTLKGEEWRVPAMKLIWEAAGRSGGWNEFYERLEGMLFGYEDWQNDWWIDNGKRRGNSFYDLSLCCTVAAAGLAWMESAGLKALPPIEMESLTLGTFDPDRADELEERLANDPQAVAVVRFSVPRRALINLIDLSGPGPWNFPAAKMPELNREIRGSAEIVLRRT